MDVYIEVLHQEGYAIVQLGKLGGSKISLRSYPIAEIHDARRFAGELSELLNCPQMETTKA